MSFFLKKDSDGNAKQKKRGVKRPAQKKDEKQVKLTRRQKAMQQTEISSDEEDSIGDAPISAGSEDEYDDVNERSYREAKQLLSKLEEEKGEEEDLSELLKEDAAKKAGTLKKEIADLAELREEDEVSHRAHRFTPLSVAISPCLNFVVSSGKESTIVKYNIKEDKVVGVIKRNKKKEETPNAHSGLIFAVAISSDGRYIVSGGHDSVLKVWDFSTLAHLRDFTGHRAPITSLCFQLKSNYLFSASRDRSVKLWDLDQMGLVDTMYGHQDAVLSVSALQRQRVVTAGAQDRTCRLWKVEDESQLVFTANNDLSVDCVAMLNDEHFVSGSSNGSLSLWSLWKKKPVAVRSDVHGKRETGESRWIVSIAAVPFSDLVATGSDDGELKLWKISSDYKKIFQVYAYTVEGFINHLQFSADGRRLAIASGQEHRDGRWWVNKEARNRITVLTIRYGDLEESAKDAVSIDLGSDSDDED